MNSEYQPKIIGFLCNWCSYAGADMAGTSRMRYEPNIRIIRVPCSGRVDPILLLKCFQQGSDGVLVSGCHLVIATIMRVIIMPGASSPFSVTSLTIWA